MSTTKNNIFQTVDSEQLIENNIIIAQQQGLQQIEGFKEQQNYFNHVSKIVDEEILKEANKVLRHGRLSDGSKKQYQGPIIKFFRWLKQNFGRLTRNSFDLELYLQQFQLSLQSLSALNRIKLVYHLILKENYNLLMKEARQWAYENKKHSPNRSWNVHLIQKFILDLLDEGLELQAFRIYALFRLGARLSELSQITFQMMLNGEISYIPKKQQKLGEAARRILELPSEIKNRTRKFIDKNQISSTATLNIGKKKQKITESALQQNLEKAKSIIQVKSNIEDQEYLEFLKCFSYHDLRHSKAQQLNQLGAQVESIQEFFKHTSR